AEIICSRKSGPVSIAMRVMRPSGLMRSTSAAGRRRRFFGSVGSQLPQSPLGRGTPGDEPHPTMVKRSMSPMSGRSRHLIKKSEEILGRDRRDLVFAHTDRLGQHFGGVLNKGRLVALAAMRRRRKVRRVGLDQHPVAWHITSDRADLFGLPEGEDA